MQCNLKNAFTFNFYLCILVMYIYTQSTYICILINEY